MWRSARLIKNLLPNLVLQVISFFITHFYLCMCNMLFIFVNTLSVSELS